MSQSLSYLILRLSFPFSLTFLLLLALSMTVSNLKAEGVTRRLVPIGASYQEATLQLFAQQAIAQDTDGTVEIRVLPIPYHTNSMTITAEVRAENLKLAQSRAAQVQEACEAVANGALTCVATVPDIQIRADAFEQENLDMLTAEVDGVYILGGDQLVAMEVVANTPVEDALEALYEAGTVIGGNSAGAAVQSRYMIGGYATLDDYAWHGLQYDSIELWYGEATSVTRGLRFGLDNAIIDQHVLERGRIPRLLQAVQRSPSNKIGLGVDWGSGSLIENEQVVMDSAGSYLSVILDQESYDSAQNAQYLGPSESLSIRDVAMHLLPEGAYGYDLVAQRPIMSGTMDTELPDITGRTFEMLQAPLGAGRLFLTGDIGNEPQGAVATRFATLAEASGGPTIVLAAAFANDADATSAANDWANALSELGVSNVETAILTNDTDLDALATQLSAASTLFITGDDQEVMADRVSLLTNAPINLAQLWQSGKLLLLDNAAAAAAGEWMSDEPTPTGDTLEYQSSDSFLADYLNIQPGLALLQDATFEPRVLYDYLHGRLVSHVYHHSDTVAFGIERDTALEISPLGAEVLGAGVVMAIDGRYAGLQEEGTNGGIAATWLFLDTYTNGESLFETTVTAVQLSHLDTEESTRSGLVLLMGVILLAGGLLWLRWSN